MSSFAGSSKVNSISVRDMRLNTLDDDHSDVEERLSVLGNATMLGCPSLSRSNEVDSHLCGTSGSLGNATYLVFIIGKVEEGRR